MTKVFVVLNAVLTVALSCLFIASAAQWDNYKALANSYKTQRDAAITERQTAEAGMQLALAAKDEAFAAQRLELTQARSESERLSNDLAKALSDLAEVKSERMAFEAGRTKLREILDVTMAELKSEQAQNQTLLTSNMDLETRNARLNSRILELTTQVTILTDENRNIQEKLYACETANARAAAPVASSPRVAGSTSPTVSFEAPGTRGSTPAVAGPIRGRVTAITGRTASIDVGEASGVRTGMMFIVSRNGAYVSDLVIDTVRPTEAGGKVDAGADVRVGDAVVYGVE